MHPGVRVSLYWFAADAAAVSRSRLEEPGEGEKSRKLDKAGAIVEMVRRVMQGGKGKLGMGVESERTLLLL